MSQPLPAVRSPRQKRQDLLAKALLGDARSQCAMGELHRLGDQFTPQNYAEALKWFRLAAGQGFAAAQNNLGTMIEDGMGVPPDAAEAEKWYRLAADQGLPNAQSNLDRLRKWTNGVPIAGDDEVTLLRKAAAGGDIRACVLLGTRHRHGDGVPKLIPVAAELHVIAALEGDKEAIAALADYRDEIEAEALGGNLLASLCLAKMFDRGLAVERDQGQMLAWLLWADRCPTGEDEADVREEQADMREFYAAVLAEDIRDRASQLFNAIRRKTEAALPRTGPTEAKAAGGR